MSASSQSPLSDSSQSPYADSSLGAPLASDSDLLLNNIPPSEDSNSWVSPAAVDSAAYILVHVTHPMLTRINLTIELRFRWEALFTEPIATATISTLQFVPHWRNGVVLPALLSKLQGFYDSYDIPDEESQAINNLLQAQAESHQDFTLSAVNYLTPDHPSFFPGSGQEGIAFQLAAQVTPSNLIAVCDLPISGQAGRALMRVYSNYCTFPASSSASVRSTTATVLDEVARLRARLAALDWPSPAVDRSTPVPSTIRARSRCPQLLARTPSPAREVSIPADVLPATPAVSNSPVAPPISLPPPRSAGPSSQWRYAMGLPPIPSTAPSNPVGPILHSLRPSESIFPSPDPDWSAPTCSGWNYPPSTSAIHQD